MTTLDLKTQGLGPGDRSEVKSKYYSLVLVVQIFKLSMQEAEAGRPLSWRPAWFTQQVLGHLGIHSVIMSQQQQNKQES